MFFAESRLLLFLLIAAPICLGRDLFYEPPELENPSELLQQSYQYRLLNDILNPDLYDPRVRPVRDVRRPVQVKIKMMLYQIIDVVEPEQTIILNTWLTQYWEDEFLGWLPVTYGDITQIMLPVSDIWTPDTYLYNSLEMSQESTERLMSVVVNTDTSGERPVARITMMYPAIYRFSCQLYVKFYPFDIQQCRMSFGSWTYDIMGINYTENNPQVLMDEFKASEEWKILSFTWNRTEVERTKYGCCPHPYVMLHAELVIQRKPLFTIVNLVLPSAIISLVAICGFFMPTNTVGERSEKVNLGITTLLAMAILLLMVVDQMPATSEFVPIMGWFYLTVIGLISVGTLMTSVIICLQRRGEFGIDVPWYWLRFAKVSRRVLFVPVKKQLQAYWRQKDGFNKNKPERHHTFDNGDTLDDLTMSTLIRDPTGNSHDIQLVSPSPHNAHKCGWCTAQEQDGPITDDEGRILEWELVTDCIDRLLLITFSTAVVLVTSGILLVGQAVMEDEMETTVSEAMR